MAEPMTRVIDHPLASVRLATIRDRATDRGQFRTALEQLTHFLVYEACRDLPVTPIDLDTPMGPTRGVTITARSNGCTDKSYFDTDVDRDDGEYEISFERVRADNCRAFLRDGVELTWSLGELGIPDGARVIVLTRSSS